MSATQLGQELAIAFPFEFTIGHTPVSAQTNNSMGKQRWIKTVAQHAQKALNSICDQYFTDGRPLAATIYYFPQSLMQGDVDNIVKPILDGMVYVAYPDDKVIERVVVQKFEPGVAWVFTSPSEILATAIDMEKPSLYIRLEDDLAWRKVP